LFIRNIQLVIVLALLSVLAPHAMADAGNPSAAKGADDLSQPPPLAPEQPPGDAEPPDSYLEPEITIVVKQNAVQYEYRINGQLYMIKVVPEKGKPYYLVDPDGTGQWRRSFTSDVVPPQWVIKQF
jgi:Protein of unknown function (DUF2782)